MNRSIVICLVAAHLMFGQAIGHPVLQVQKEDATKILLAKIDRSGLPQGVILDPAFQQSFLLKVPGEEDLGVIAAYLNFEPSAAPSAPPEQCGVLFLPANGSSRYIATLKPDVQRGYLNCGGVRAVGLANDAGSRPRLIFIFNNTLLHGDEDPVPFIFAWDANANTYNLDITSTGWLRHQTRDIGTLARVRRLLANHPRK